MDVRRRCMHVKQQFHIFCCVSNGSKPTSDDISTQRLRLFSHLVTPQASTDNASLPYGLPKDWQCQVVDQAVNTWSRPVAYWHWLIHIWWHVQDFNIGSNSWRPQCSRFGHVHADDNYTTHCNPQLHCQQCYSNSAAVLHKLIDWLCRV